MGIKYGSPEIEHPVEGVLLFSPDHQTKVLFEGEGFMLSRKVLARRQVEDAKKLGVEFAFGVNLDCTHRRGRMDQGRRWQEPGWFDLQEDGEGRRGLGRLRDEAQASLPDRCKIEKELDREDLESTGRYIFDFEKGIEDKTWFDPKYAIIHFDQYSQPRRLLLDVCPRGEQGEHRPGCPEVGPRRQEQEVREEGHPPGPHRPVCASRTRP